MDDRDQLKRYPGRLYSSECSLVVRRQEFVRDVKGYYRLLGFNPNKGWISHDEIKRNFRGLVKLANNEGLNEIVEKLIEAWVVLSDREKRYWYDKQQVDWDEVDLSKVVYQFPQKVDVLEPFAYYSEIGEVSEDFVRQWLQCLSNVLNQRGRSQVVRVGFTRNSQGVKRYAWGEIILVPRGQEPSKEVADYLVSLV